MDFMIPGLTPGGKFRTKRPIGAVQYGPAPFL